MRQFEGCCNFLGDLPDLAVLDDATELEQAVRFARSGGYVVFQQVQVFSVKRIVARHLRCPVVHWFICVQRFHVRFRFGAGGVALDLCARILAVYAVLPVFFLDFPRHDLGFLRFSQDKLLA